MAGAHVFSFWTDLLDLPGFIVVNLEEDVALNRYVFTLTPQHQLGVCPKCSKPSDTVKQRRTWDEIVDLPIGSRAVELIVRVNQFECESCGQCFTPPIDFLSDGAHATERLLKRAAELVRHSDVSNAAQFFRIPEKNLERWYYDYVERHQQQMAESPRGTIRRIGIDELSLKKDIDSSSR